MSPTCPITSTKKRFQLQSSEARALHQYIFDDNSTESPDPEIDDEHIKNALASPLYIQEREANASRHRFITLMKKACHQVHGQSQLARRDPLHGCHSKENLAKSWMTVESGIFLEVRRKDCSQKKNPKS